MRAFHIMLKATELWTWSAKLTKFSRGRPEAASSTLAREEYDGSRRLRRTGLQVSNDSIVWQHFSGPHLCCRVFSSRPSGGTWSQEQSWPNGGDNCQVAHLAAHDRELRIVVECGLEQMDAPSSSQNRPCVTTLVSFSSVLHL